MTNYFPLTKGVGGCSIGYDSYLSGFLTNETSPGPFQE